MAESEREKVILERVLTLKQLIKDDRGGPVELHELAICYYNLANYDRAAEFLDQLLEKYPDYLEAGAVVSLRIFCLIQEGHYKEAETLLKERLHKFPEDTTLLALSAHIEEKRENFRKAIETHRRIVDLDPENVNSLNSIGYLLALHGSQEEQQEAMLALKKALENKPDHPAYLDSFGVFLARKGLQDQARKALMKALKKAPDNSEILKHLKELLGV